MAALTLQEKEQLPPMVVPYGRSLKGSELKVLQDGEIETEGFDPPPHAAEFNSEPGNIVYITEEEIEMYLNVDGRFEEKCFLWVIDEAIIRIIREQTPNFRRTYDPTCVCHTNLTGGQQAHMGGEMFFSEDGRVFINPFSDRYGSTNISPAQWEATKEYFISVGYTNLIDILELLNINLAG